MFPRRPARSRADQPDPAPTSPIPKPDSSPYLHRMTVGRDAVLLDAVIAVEPTFNEGVLVPDGCPITS